LAKKSWPKKVGRKKLAKKSWQNKVGKKKLAKKVAIKGSKKCGKKGRKKVYS